MNTLGGKFVATKFFRDTFRNKLKTHKHLSDLGFSEFLPSLNPTSGKVVVKNQRGCLSKGVKCVDFRKDLNSDVIQEYVIGTEFSSMFFCHKGEIIHNSNICYGRNKVRVDRTSRQQKKLQENDHYFLDSILNNLLK